MPAPNDPELLLTAACCRWPPSPARDEAVREAAGRIGDWGRFEKSVAQHRVAGLVHAALRAAGVAPPPATAEALAGEADRIARRGLVTLAETARLTRLISAAGYRVLAVKGATLAALAYGSAVLKHGKDIDLLVAPEHAQAVIALLEADAYRLSLPAEDLSPAQRRLLTRYGKDVTLVRRSPAAQVELHWRLFSNRALAPGLTAASPAQAAKLAGTIIADTLSTPDLFAYLTLHGAAEGWRRLKWLADVNALLAGRDQAEIAALYEHAQTLGAGRCAAQALLLSRDLLGLGLAPAFAERLAASRRVRMMVAGAYRLMAGREDSTELPHWWGGRMQVQFQQPLLADGILYQWNNAKGLLYVQSDMFRSRAPTALYILYPLLRMPLWVGRRLGLLRESAEPRP